MTHSTIIARFILAIALTMLPSWAQNDILQQTFRAIPEGGILKSTFTQKRYLKGIPYALTSSGDVTLWAGKGVLWRTQTPFPALLVMNQTGLYHGQGTTKTSLFKNGKMGKEGAIFDILSNILKGNFSQIKGFSTSILSQTTKGTTWGVRLTPHGQLAKFISSVEIEGIQKDHKQLISHISIKRTNGDHDEIMLKDPRLYGPEEATKALTMQEQDLLND